MALEDGLAEVEATPSGAHASADAKLAGASWAWGGAWGGGVGAALLCRLSSKAWVENDLVFGDVERDCWINS